MEETLESGESSFPGALSALQRSFTLSFSKYLREDKVLTGNVISAAINNINHNWTFDTYISFVRLLVDHNVLQKQDISLLIKNSGLNTTDNVRTIDLYQHFLGLAYIDEVLENK